ncbi:MAG: penicillin-insensitive murein endopeptidase, partial [Syntrophobacteraceae bacterium]
DFGGMSFKLNMGGVMKGLKSRGLSYYALILPAVCAISSVFFFHTCQAITASYGEPYKGYLVNGIVFPNMFPGYHVRDYNRAYTTPELAGALLDAIEAVKTKFPGTCDVFIGDFSKNGGGRFGSHSSHQNGRDVDVGLYAKNNCQLENLVPMNGDNLDPAKTLFLISNLVASQRVQYIFLDRRIQKVLYDYGISHGYNEAYLNRLFGNVPGALVQDIPGHFTHMHVRFFTPWSTLASRVGAEEANMRSIIAVAQESYLPKKVDYYVTGNEKGIPQLARSFGISVNELCAWNHINTYSVLVPGSCLVFYKRNFESGPVQLACSLQPGYIAQAAALPVRVASAQPQSAQPVMSDSIDLTEAPSESSAPASHPFHTPAASQAQTRSKAARVSVYTVKHGGTLKDIARQTGTNVSSLSRLNRLSSNARLRAGTKIKLAGDMQSAASEKVSQGRRSSPSRICFASESEKSGLTAAYYRVAHQGTLKDVAVKTGIPLSSLCRLNRLSRNARLKRGQMIKLAQADLPVRPSLGRSSCAIKFHHHVKKASLSKKVKGHAKPLKSTKAQSNSAKKTLRTSRSTQAHAAARVKGKVCNTRSGSHKALAKKELKGHNSHEKKVHKAVSHSKTRTKAAKRSRSCKLAGR